MMMFNQEIELMARVVLVFVCGILVFVLVSRFAPHFVETYLTSATSSGSTTSSPDATDSSKASPEKGKNAVAKPKSRTAARSSATAAAAPAKQESANPEASFTETPAGGNTQIPPAPARSVTRVTAENATLYLANTGGGPVVGRLAKGAVVEPVFVVSTAGQTWTFVSSSDQEITGFLRSDTLAKPRQADQPSR
jgi:cytoskeletal protein RodZ